MLHYAVATLALVANKQAPSSLMKLRGGGLPSVEDTSKYLGYLTLASGVHTFAYPKENADLYKPSKPLDTSALSFARLNGAMQIALSQVLLGGDVTTALALGIYGYSAAEADNMGQPKLPLMAWAAFLLGNGWLVEKGLPDWVLPGALVANGAYGLIDTQAVLDLYECKTKVSRMATLLVKIVCAAQAAIGSHMLLGVLGKSDAERFTALTGIFGLGVLNMVVNELDGEFDESGGYAWSALWLGAAAIGFQAM
jgi:hypothetical protein